MLNVILYQPEIPPNTGNIIRLCANTGAHLHLIGPLGFTLDNRRLLRAGLDYHEFAELNQYSDWEEFKNKNLKMRIIGLSTSGKKRYCDYKFENGDGLLFGTETRGLPDSVRSQVGQNQILKLPMKEGSRSLNLSNSVAIVLFEAWRQLDFKD